MRQRHSLRTRYRIELNARQLGVPAVELLGRYDYPSAQPGLAMHSHRNAMEFCFLARGRQTYRVGGRAYTLRGGDVFLTYPNESHSTGGQPEEKGALYWLILRMPGPGRPFLLHRGRAAQALAHQLRGLRSRHFRGTRKLQRILDDILHTATTPAAPLRTLAISNQLVAFLLELLACAGRTPPASPSPPVTRALAQIDAQLAQPVYVAALARATGLSESRFKARFKAETGIPPGEYILRRKIERAQRLLAQPGKTITAVAFELGFSSSQYFATVFKRYTGQNPRVYSHR